MNSADYFSVVESFAPGFAERILTGPECDSALDAAIGLAMAPTRKHGTEGRQ